jgi:hypothetical protein
MRQINPFGATHYLKRIIAYHSEENLKNSQYVIARALLVFARSNLLDKGQVASSGRAKALLPMT